MADDPNFVGAIPLYAYTQGLEEGSLERAFGDLIVAESDVLAAIPIKPVTGGKFRYPQIAELPTVQNRAYNEPGNLSQGRIEMQEEGIFIQDEYIKYDRALDDHFGPQGRATQERLRMIAMSREMTRLILKGDHQADPRDPDGMQARSATLEQTVVHNSASSGGAGLSLNKLDEAVNETSRPTHIIMDRLLKPRLQAAARSPTLTNNFINYDRTDPLGRKVMAYGDLPILFGYPKSTDSSILPYSEVASGGGSAVTTSIYIVRFDGEDGMFMIENVPLTVRDEGQLPGLPLISTHIKWDKGLVSMPFSVTRLTSISNAAITA